jgi:glucarate dehydratase
VSDVRITGIRATPVNIPLTAAYRWSGGVFPGFTRTIVEVESNAGIVGIGEGQSAADAAVIADELGPRLVGADPYDFVDCERRALTSQHALNTTHDDRLRPAYGAVEMGLWDLVGHLEKRGVAELLGGRVRDSVPFTEYFAFRVGVEETPADVARYCAKMQEEHDPLVFEGKVGARDLESDRQMLEAVRSAIGEKPLMRIDANMKWGVAEARVALDAFDGAGISSVEEPVATFFELEQLRRTSRLTFSAHHVDLQAAVRFGVPDAFVINLVKCGGIRRTIDLVKACAHFGIKVWFYSPDTGVGNAAFLQVAAAVEELTEPNQTLLRWHKDDVICEGLFSADGGHIEVPTGPGLGVTLDRTALQRCHERFQRSGAFSHYSYLES